MSETQITLHNHQKKIAAMNDFTGFGRCALTVSLPIISALKVQCCPVPTAVFSNHTAFKSYYMHDFTPEISDYIAEWKKLDLQFNGIYTGFLGSEEQIEVAAAFIGYFKKKDTIAVIDPIMGDSGKTYSTYTEEMCRRMKELIQYADILTPNLTEACILTDRPYRRNYKIEEIRGIAENLSAQGPGKVVITGIPQKSYICNFCYEAGQEPKLVKSRKIGNDRAGTGDIFASIIAADAVNGVPFYDSVKKASGFVKKCIQASMELDIPSTDGVCFEEVLHTLR